MLELTYAKPVVRHSYDRKMALCPPEAVGSERQRGVQGAVFGLLGVLTKLPLPGSIVIVFYLQQFGFTIRNHPVRFHSYDWRFEDQRDLLQALLADSPGVISD